MSQNTPCISVDLFQPVTTQEWPRHEIFKRIKLLISKRVFILQVFCDKKISVNGFGYVPNYFPIKTGKKYSVSLPQPTLVTLDDRQLV